MLIPSLFLKVMPSKAEKSSINKALAEIKEPTRKYDASFGPPPYTGKGSGKNGWDKTKAAYSQLENEVYSMKKDLAQPQQSLGQRMITTFKNMPNIVRNAYDNSVGYGIASYQNYKTAKVLKKEQGKRVAYIMNGLAQNIGPGHRRGKEMMKKGILPYHLKSHHSEPLEKAHNLTLDQIREFHKKAKVVEANKRSDALVGHSSGGNYVIYAAGDKKMKELGIKYAQAIAPTPYGIRVKTPGQKLMGTVVDLKVDDVGKSKTARENALKMYNRKPVISVDVIAGKYDGLVPVQDTAYKYADKHHVLDHPKSTHFGTSGSNNEINKILVGMLKEHMGRYKDKEYKPK